MLPPAPPGLHDQMMRGDGYGPRPFVPPPMGPRSSLIVGGPAYFTPEGYEAPYQPEAAFMPTDRRSDPIRDQFIRMNPPPPPPTPEPPYIGPILPPTPMPPPTTQGGVEEPTPYVPTPVSSETEGPVIPPPANGFFPDGVPDFSNIDFSGLNLDLSGLQDINFEDTDFSNIPDLSNVPGLADLDFSGLPQYQMPPPPPPPPSLAEPTPAPSYIPEELIDVGYGGTQKYIPMRKIVGPNPDYVPPANAPTKSIREALATPAPIYTPPPPIEEMFEDYDYGNPNLRNRGMFGPGR